MDPPALEKVVGADPGVTDVAGWVVVVVLDRVGGVAVEVTGVAIVVVVATVGLLRAVGKVVVVTPGVAWPREREPDGRVDGAVGCVNEDEGDVVGTLQVVIAPCGAGDDVAPVATPGAGMTGSGGDAIALVTAPTPTQLTTVAVAVATIQAAIGSGVTRRIQRFSPHQQQIRTKATIIRRPHFRPWR
jgi:hypothetical protein